MEKNPYLKDWVRSIESMSKEELIKIIEEGERDEDYLDLVRKRLASIIDDETLSKVDESSKVENSKDQFRNKGRKDVDNNSAENSLSFLAVFVLIVGIIAGIFLFVLWLNDSSSESYSSLVAAISVIISSLISWAVLKVFVNISKTLKEINHSLSQIKN